jgi:gas vesicle protein
MNPYERAKEKRMNRRLGILSGLIAGALLAAAPAVFAADQKPEMHMHKSDMDHRPDKEVATEYQSEADQLRAKAESHRKLAKSYQELTPPKGSANYANVVKHCEKLAQYYDEAAKEAEGVAAELAK